MHTFDELITPDERSLRFTPLGFGLDVGFGPTEAARFQQETVSRFKLADEAPAATRESLERLRTIHAYGGLCYDLYTAAYQLALPALELALRERFVANYDGAIPLVGVQREKKTIRASRFDKVHRALRDDMRSGWQLDLGNAGTMQLRGYLRDLLDWARRVGLLRGQVNRRREPVLADLRNLLAHPTGQMVVSPVESARRIGDITEIVNQLWGSATPGGRLYPEPVERLAVAIGWADASDVSRLAADRLETAELDPGWTYIIVKAVPHDVGLWMFDTRFEFTAYPASLLWGPGPLAAARQWWREHASSPDRVDYLDRRFIVRVVDAKADWARRPSVAVGLPETLRRGTWHLVLADDPSDAVAHVRGPGGNPDPRCSRLGPCNNCAVTSLAVGDWGEVASHLEDVAAEAPDVVFVPSIIQGRFGLDADASERRPRSAR